MDEYTYKDIIIDPTSKEAKNAVGKEVYFADTPASCLNAAKNNNKAYLGYLKKLDLGDEEQPFYVNEFVVSAPSSWTCIIVKKEEPKPKYIPFENVTEFLDAYRSAPGCMPEEVSYLSNNGIWLNDMETDAYCMVTEIWDSGIVIGDKSITIGETVVFHDITAWEELLKNYTFLWGTPCGKLMEDNND